MSAAEDFAFLFGRATSADTTEALERLRDEFRELGCDLDAAEQECAELNETVAYLEAEGDVARVAWWLADDLHREAHWSGLFVLCRETACLRLKDALLPGWRENRPAAWLRASG